MDYYERLNKAGMPEAQARELGALIRGFNDELRGEIAAIIKDGVWPIGTSSKSDILELRKEIQEVRKELRGEIQDGRKELVESRSELGRRIQNVYSNLNKAEFDITKWVTGLTIAFSALLLIVIFIFTLALVKMDKSHKEALEYLEAEVSQLRDGPAGAGTFY